MAAIGTVWVIITRESGNAQVSYHVGNATSATALVAPHLKMEAHAKVVESPKHRASTTVDTSPIIITKRQPYRSLTSPQKCADNNRPIMKAEESKPAKYPAHESQRYPLVIDAAVRPRQ